MRFICLACGHEFDDRLDTPNRRQCSVCGRRRVIEAQKYRNAIIGVKEILRSLTLDDPFVIAKIGWDIWHKAAEELFEERKKRR